MDGSLVRKFRLSPSGSGRGISCDANGAFVGEVALLKRTPSDDGRAIWQPRGCEVLSEELSAVFGLPIDVSPKSPGLAAIADALNTGDIVRAQLVALHLEIPDPLPLAKGSPPRSEWIKLIRALYVSQLIKADWDSDEHPRWPAGAPDSQGGKFAPKGEGDAYSGGSSDVSASGKAKSSANVASSDEDHVADDFERHPASPAPIAAVSHSNGDGQFEDVVYRGVFHDEMVASYSEYLSRAGFNVETEVRLQMADRSAGTRIDILVQMGGVTVGVEVKTGENPFPTLSQLLIYPHLMYGESVVSDDSKIATFGFKTGQLLPPVPVMVMYVRDRDTKPFFDDLDPKKMLEEYYRKIGRLKKMPTFADVSANTEGI